MTDYYPKTDFSKQLFIYLDHNKIFHGGLSKDSPVCTCKFSRQSRNVTIRKLHGTISNYSNSGYDSQLMRNTTLAI